MRKISLLFAIIVLLAGVSVQAQKKRGPTPIGPPAPKFLTVQDQDGGGFIVFDLSTGEFKCNMCEYKYAFSGPGDVKINGFDVSLSAVTDKYQVFVTVNMWDRVAKAVMYVPSSSDTGLAVDMNGGEGIQEFWTDLNIDNNTLNCASIQPKK